MGIVTGGVNMKHDYSMLLIVIPLIWIIIFFLKENGIFYAIKRSSNMRKWKKINPEKYAEELEKNTIYSNIEFSGIGGIHVKDMYKFCQRPKVQAQIKKAQECAELQAQGIELDFSKCEQGPSIEFYHKEK